MVRRFLFVIAAVVFGVAPGAAQNAVTPGASPFRYAYPNAYFDYGGVALPSTVPGGYKGVGTINAQGLYQNGAPMAPSAFSDTTNANNITSGTLGLARLPHVPNNAALQVLSPTIGRVRREGFATSGDGGVADYNTSTALCSQNSGAGDGGSCIGLIGPNGTAGAYVGSAQVDPHTALNGTMFGGDCSGVADSTAAVQAMVNAATSLGMSVRPVRSCVLKLTSPVTVTGRIDAEGPGAQLTNNGNTGAADPQTIGSGYWFHLAHTGKGFVFVPVGGVQPQNFTNGIVWHGFGTFRDQAPPPTTSGAAYTPCACDYDIAVYNGAIDYDGVVLNSSKGIYLSKGDRSRIRDLEGQPLVIGLDIESAYDVVKIDRVHLWQFWTSNPNVLSYVNSYGIGVQTGRADNLAADYIFGIDYNKCFDVAQYAGGGPGGVGNDGSYPGGALENGQITKLDCDNSANGVYVEANANPTFFNIADLGAGSSGLQYPTQTNASPISINAVGAQVTIGHASVAFGTQSNVYVGGNYSTLSINTLITDGWNEGSTSANPTNYADLNAPGTGASITVDHYVVRGGAAQPSFTAPLFGTNAHLATIPIGAIGSALTVNASTNPTNIPAGGSITLPFGSAELTVRDAATGAFCKWDYTTGVVYQIAGSANCATSPATGKLSLSYNGSYVLTNNQQSNGNGVAAALFGSSQAIAPFD